MITVILIFVFCINTSQTILLTSDNKLQIIYKTCPLYKLKKKLYTFIQFTHAQFIL